MNLKPYKGYDGAVTTIDPEADLITGEVMGIRAVLHFQARTPGELQAAFEGTVDDYLSWCVERGKDAEKPFSGQFVVRLEPELHREIAIAATGGGVSINRWVKETLSRAVGKTAEGDGRSSQIRR